MEVLVMDVVRVIQIFFIVTVLSLLVACGSNDTPITAPADTNKTVTPLPAALQKLTLNGGTLRAFLVLDNDQLNPFDMVINNEGEGSATVVIPNLTRDFHDIVITYEYTDVEGTIILAQLDTTVDLRGGDRNLDILATSYEVDIFDADGDNISNAAELLAQTDPRLPESVLSGGFNLFTTTAVPLLSDVARAAGTLRGYITIDNTSRREIFFDQGATTASIVIPGLSQASHNVLITFEYDDGKGIIVIAESSLTTDLRQVNGDQINLEKIDFEVSQFDIDKDGLSNADELFFGTDPRALSAPFLPAQLSIDSNAYKSLRFNWLDVPDASYYLVFERIPSEIEFKLISGNIDQNTQVFVHTFVSVTPLFSHLNAEYKLQSCNDIGCTDGEILNVTDPLIDSITYIKSDGTLLTNTNVSVGFGREISLSNDGKTLAVGSIQVGSNSVVTSSKVSIFSNINGKWQQTALVDSDTVQNVDAFGLNVVLSGDGNTLAISAILDNNLLSGINNTAEGVPIVRDNSTTSSYGAVYIFTRNGNIWTQEAYIKPNIIDAFDQFSRSMALSEDGNTLAVGASLEDSNAVGINANNGQADNSSDSSGAAYVFKRENRIWSQQAYIKASNTDSLDFFGFSLTLSGDGLTLVVAAADEDSGDEGVDNNVIGANAPSQLDNSVASSGAVYVYVLNTQAIPPTWSQQAYIKASNPQDSDLFGFELDLNKNGNTLVVSAALEDSGSNINQFNNTLEDSGAVYVYQRANSIWAQEAYIKANNIHGSARFGADVEISNDGNIMGVGAYLEKSDAVGLNGDEANKEFVSGAAYLFAREANGVWNQQTYIKASNPDSANLVAVSGDQFGRLISLSGDASTFAASAIAERSSSIGIDGDQSNNDGVNIGAVYLY